MERRQRWRRRQYKQNEEKSNVRMNRNCMGRTATASRLNMRLFFLRCRRHDSIAVCCNRVRCCLQLFASLRCVISHSATNYLPMSVSFFLTLMLSQWNAIYSYFIRIVYCSIRFLCGDLACCWCLLNAVRLPTSLSLSLLKLSLCECVLVSVNVCLAKFVVTRIAI